MSGIIRRRTLLKAALATGLHGLAGGLFPFAARARDSDALQDALQGLFPNKEHALAVGRRYLALDPAASAGSVRRTRQLLEPHFGQTSLIINAVRNRRSLDFARRDSIILDGWVLARCEADLCAALALLSHT